MQPIFGDMLKMWADMGYDLPMKEGRFWLENNFIQGFTPDGEMHKLYKYKVNSDLSIEITPYRTNKSVILYPNFYLNSNCFLKLKVRKFNFTAQ